MDDFTLGQWTENTRGNRALDRSEQSAWAWRNHAEQLSAQLRAARQQVDSANASAVSLRLQLIREQQEKVQLQGQLDTLTVTNARNRIAGQAAQEMARELRSHIETHRPTDALGRKEVVSARLDQRRRQLAHEAGYVVLPGDEFEIARK